MNTEFFGVKNVALFSISILSLLSPFVQCERALANDEQTQLVIRVETDGTLDGSYTKNNKSIYFEAIRGEFNIENDPALTPYALDVRVLDNNKIPFLTKSNQVTQDDGWLLMDDDVNEEERQTSLDMLPDAISELKEAYINVNSENQKTENIEGLTNDNRWELWEVIELMRSAVEEKNRLNRDISRIKMLVNKNASKTVYTHEVAIMRKPAVIDNTNYEHSAILVTYYKNNKFYARSSSCNHGACGDNKTMSKKCSKKFDHDKMLPLQDTMCDKVTSYGFSAGKHVCNNDTKAQYLQFKKGTADYSVCYSWLKSAPSCD